MGNYYVGGKLRSADTIAILGRRTLAGVTEEAVWAGVAATRPTPGNVQLRMISTSTQDGPAIAQVGTIDVACTVEPGDTISVDDGATQFDYVVAVNDTLTSELATGLAAAIDLDAAYSASAIGAQITVIAAVAGTPFTFIDVSADNQTVDIILTIADEGVQANVIGTGCKTVRLDYLDGDGVRASEAVTLDGLVAVLTTATDIGAVLGVTCMTFGTGNAAAGDITVTDGAGAVIYDFIASGTTQGFAAASSVPVGLRLYLTAIHGSADLATKMRVRSDVNPATGAIVAGASYEWHSAIVGTGLSPYEPAVPIGPFPAGALVWITMQDAAATETTVTVAGYLEPAV